MSQENAEILRRAYEAFNRGDIESAVADIAPDSVYVSGGMPGFEDTYRGVVGYRRFLETFWREFDDPHVEVDELIDARDQVFASITLRGVGKHSGAETSWNVWQVWTVREGKAVHGQAFARRDAALEAAGLLD
jgi:ketosteroid isomerase-like protein